MKQITSNKDTVYLLEDDQLQYERLIRIPTSRPIQFIRDFGIVTTLNNSIRTYEDTSAAGIDSFVTVGDTFGVNWSRKAVSFVNYPRTSPPTYKVTDSSQQYIDAFEIIDGLNRVKDEYIAVRKSTVIELYRTIGQERVELDSFTLNNFYITGAQLRGLKDSGTFEVSGNTFQLRFLPTCNQSDTVTLRKKLLPGQTDLVIDTMIVIRNVNPQDTQFIDKDADLVVDRGFELTMPGVYRVRAQANNLLGCFNVAQTYAIYGHFARFNIKGADSIICVGDEVEFEHKVRYFQYLPNCPRVGIIQLQACLMEDGPQGSFLGALYPWDGDYKTNQIATRKARNTARGLAAWETFNVAGDKAGNFFRNKEKMFWDFEGDGIYEYEGNEPKHTYTKPGIYTVRMKTVDSNACTVVTERSKLIKVIGLTPNFVVSASTDSPLLCAPQEVTFIDSTKYEGSDSTEFSIFYSKEKVRRKIATVNNQPIYAFVDTFVEYDRLNRYRWVPQEDKDTVNRLAPVDSATFIYDKNDTFTPALIVTSNNGCESTVIKNNLGYSHRTYYYCSSRYNLSGLCSYKSQSW